MWNKITYNKWFAEYILLYCTWNHTINVADMIARLVKPNIPDTRSDSSEDFGAI